jgi:hypothetical protein
MPAGLSTREAVEGQAMKPFHICSWSTSVFVIHANTMSDGPFGPFTLTLPIK